MCRRLCRLFLCVAVLLSVAIGISMQVGAATARTEAEACEVPSAVYSTIEAALADPLCPDITLAQGRFKENLVIERSVSITGVGAGESIIDGLLSGRVIHVKQDAVVILSDLSIVRGQSNLGGGIYNEGSLSLWRVDVTKNSAAIDGGGLHNVGSATIYESTFRSNTAVDFSGGGLRNEGRMYLTNSTVILNQADFSGGGISNEDEGRLWIFSSTIARNDGGVGGGIAGNEHGGGFVRIKNTLLTDNFQLNSSRPSDCARTIISLGYNQVADPDDCDFRSAVGDILGRPAFLGKREGVPSYYPLTCLSPAIDKGDPAGCVDYHGNLLLADQRGVARENRCDIGSVEFDGIFHRIYMPALMHIGCTNFFDDFSDPNSGWPVGENDLVRADYLDGEYRILTKDPDFFYTFLSPACPRDFYSVEVDARWVNDPGAIQGIIFGASADLVQFYFFFVNTDYQVYSIVHIDGDSADEVVPLTESDAINEGNESNRMAVYWDDLHITAVVNGIELGDWPAAGQLTPSYAGLFAGSYTDQSRSDARFDNFSVITRGAMSTAQQVHLKQSGNAAEIPFAAVFDVSRFEE